MDTLKKTSPFILLALPVILLVAVSIGMYAFTLLGSAVHEGVVAVNTGGLHSAPVWFADVLFKAVKF